MGEESERKRGLLVPLLVEHRTLSSGAGRPLPFRCLSERTGCPRYNLYIASD